MTNFYLQTPSTFCDFNASMVDVWKSKSNNGTFCFDERSRNSFPPSPYQTPCLRKYKTEMILGMSFPKRGPNSANKNSQEKRASRCIRGLSKKQKFSFLWFSQFPHATESYFLQIHKPDWYSLLKKDYRPNRDTEVPILTKFSFPISFVFW